MVFLAGLIIVLIFFLTKKTAPSLPANENLNGALPNILPVNINGGQGLKAPEAVIAEPPSTDQTYLETLSLNYAEKLGSYSNQSNLANFLDLFDWSTNSMQSYLNNLIEGLNNESDDYYHGLTTKVLNVTINSLSSDLAETVMTTQRQETDESLNILNRITYPNLKLKLVKSGDQWLVDGAWWQ